MGHNIGHSNVNTVLLTVQTFIASEKIVVSCVLQILTFSEALDLRLS